MKLLLFFLTLFFCISAFSNELSGTIWSLSGVGCRDASLSSDSHVSKSLTSSDTTANFITFVNDKVVNITETVQGRTKTHVKNYSIEGNEIFVDGKTIGYLIKDRLIMIGNRHESSDACCNVQEVENWRNVKEDIEREGKETWKEHKRRHNFDVDDQWIAGTKEELEGIMNKCFKEKPFVYVLGKV